MENSSNLEFRGRKGKLKLERAEFIWLKCLSCTWQLIIHGEPSSSKLCRSKMYVGWAKLGRLLITISPWRRIHRSCLKHFSWCTVRLTASSHCMEIGVGCMLLEAEKLPSILNFFPALTLNLLCLWNHKVSSQVTFRCFELVILGKTNIKKWKQHSHVSSSWF